MAFKKGHKDCVPIRSRKNQAKKVSVEIKEVLGELAKIKADLSSETLVVIEGNKLLQEDAEVTVQN